MPQDDMAFPHFNYEDEDMGNLSQRVEHIRVQPAEPSSHSNTGASSNGNHPNNPAWNSINHSDIFETPEEVEMEEEEEEDYYSLPALESYSESDEDGDQMHNDNMNAPSSSRILADNASEQLREGVSSSGPSPHEMQIPMNNAPPYQLLYDDAAVEVLMAQRNPHLDPITPALAHSIRRYVNSRANRPNFSPLVPPEGEHANRNRSRVQLPTSETLKIRARTIADTLQLLDEILIRRFCNVAGGAGEHGNACSVCLESLVECVEVETNKTVRAMPCFHVFHERCLLPWFERNSTCPTCRFNMDPRRLLLSQVLREHRNTHSETVPSDLQDIIEDFAYYVEEEDFIRPNPAAERMEEIIATTRRNLEQHLSTTPALADFSFFREAQEALRWIADQYIVLEQECTQFQIMHRQRRRLEETMAADDPQITSAMERASSELDDLQCKRQALYNLESHYRTRLSAFRPGWVPPGRRQLSPEAQAAANARLEARRAWEPTEDNPYFPDTDDEDAPPTGERTRRGPPSIHAPSGSPPNMSPIPSRPVSPGLFVNPSHAQEHYSHSSQNLMLGGPYPEPVHADSELLLGGTRYAAANEQLYHPPLGNIWDRQEVFHDPSYYAQLNGTYVERSERRRTWRERRDRANREPENWVAPESNDIVAWIEERERAFELGSLVRPW